jgi:hypothetical protein
LKENNELKNEVKNLSNKLEIKSKVKNKNMQEEKNVTSRAISAMIWDILQSIAQPGGLKLSQKINPKNRVQVNYQDGDLGTMVIWG